MTHIYFGSQVVISSHIERGGVVVCVCGCGCNLIFYDSRSRDSRGNTVFQSSHVIHGGAFFSAVSEWKSISM